MIENLGTSNRAQIDEAISMLRATGAKRVGVLGLAFKAGTDDLRESPILEVIAALREDGIEVVAHDPAITPESNIAAQLGYVKYASGGLTELAEALPAMLVRSADDVVASAEALIVTQKNDTYARKLKAVLAAGETPVIDVVRSFAALPQAGTYLGIGW